MQLKNSSCSWVQLKRTQCVVVQFSSFVFNIMTPSYGASNDRSRIVWPCAHSMEIPHGKTHEVIENLCLQHGKVYG